MLVSRSQNTNQGESAVADKQVRPLRNSDRIQIKFGSYDIDIIEYDTNIRVSQLYSTHHGSKINRTFAVVTYPNVIEAAFKKEHEAIVNGQSIGVVFEHNGWTINKHHLYLGEFELPAEYSDSPALFGPGTERPAIHIYSLEVSKNNNSFTYALIAEVHHPEFLQLKDLETIYGHGHDKHLEESKTVQEFLQIVRTKIQAL
jgi:hypothetical protein